VTKKALQKQIDELRSRVEFLENKQPGTRTQPPSYMQTFVYPYEGNTVLPGTNTLVGNIGNMRFASIWEDRDTTKRRTV